ncbi:hypothetical protein QBC41DRAFT_305001 [Cercophora samala]|uniref:Uncharacterized protein n=1 Tax=Cercophora samala TaxID=330535 RepID=A0AA39Z9H9_9PEZI|nr:hypothetical protein QBC41DRAFT_305001 [Cercophora samala]
MPSESSHIDPPGSTRNFGEFFSWFETVYGEDKPAGAIEEINGKSADINNGFGGDYVWLVPKRAPKPKMMVDKLWVEIRGDNDGGRNDDLAKGAGGDYRYLSWSNDMDASRFVTDLALWRSGDEQGSPPGGWHHMSGDINKGRGGDYLYLVWRTKEYCGPKEF